MSKRSVLDVLNEMREYVVYNPDTQSGLMWCKRRGSRGVVGTEALSAVNAGGYCNGAFSGTALRAHRVVWFLHHGTLPDVIDHIDGNKLNNRIENLRSVSVLENGRNRAGKGYVTVQSAKGTRYRAQLTCNGRCIYLGTFSTAAAAEREYHRAKHMYHSIVSEAVLERSKG